MKLSKAVILFISVYLIIHFASVSHSDFIGKMAYVKTIGLEYQICIVDGNGENIQELASGLYPSWSPDGNMIIYSLGGLNDKICTMKADGSAKKSLGINGIYPLISPNGKEIAYFVIWRNPNIKIWLYLADINGDNQRRLAALNSIAGKPHSWSPDSKEIAYCDSGKLYITNVETFEFREIVCLKNDRKIEGLVNVDWSPKGDKFVLAVEKHAAIPIINKPPSRDHGLWIANTDGTNTKRLTKNDEFHPEWSPDGTEIAFASREDFLGKIFIMDADGDNIRPMLDNMDSGDSIVYPSWFGVPAAIQPQNKLVAVWGEIKSN